MTSQSHIYYDIDILNSDEKGLLPDQNLTFYETRNSPFIEKPSDYNLSIIRFQINDTTSLPVFIPEIEPNQADINKTIYHVQIKSILGVAQSTQVAVQHLSLNVDINNYPSSPVGATQERNTYYYIYQYQLFIDQINQALYTAFYEVKAILGGDIPADAIPPFLTFDVNTKKISIYASQDTFDKDGMVGLQICFNAPLQKLLSSLSYIDYGFRRIKANHPLRYALWLGVNNNKTSTRTLNNVSVPSVTSAGVYLVNECQDLDIVLWNPISSIVFTSNTLPVVATNVSTPSSLGNLSSNGNNQNLANIITDFEVGIDANNSYRNSILYSPQSEYRLFSMNSSQPLNSIDISVWWKDKYGFLSPFKLGPGSFANIKLLFRKKDYLL